MTTIDAYFDSTAREYDERTVRARPRYEEMLSQIAFALPASASDVLELGCGTGALTRIVAERYPAARITAVDASAKMIEVARERLTGAGLLPSGLNAFQVAPFEHLTLATAAYDLITANMSLHHLVDKAPLYALLRSALRPGGVLVFGDELMGASTEIEQRHYAAWLEFARRAGGLTQAELDDIVCHDELYDHYETLTRQLQLLASAGFSAVDCTWR